MVRPHDILIPPGTSWLTDPAGKAVCATIEAAGHDIYFVGGCVRNAILGLADSDVDLSTSARPKEVIALAEAAGLKAVPTGIDHGTVTVVSGGEGFEVTTFRRDVETDGRHAKVVFSNDIREDARRRDFTMNALYATPRGQVIDPLDGLPDLLARRVRFIEDAAARIREDYLRILRFFRFSAWYGDQSEGFDADTLAAISANTDGLETLSAERVGQEMAKLLAAPDPAPALATMQSCGVLAMILPGADTRLLPLVVHAEQSLNMGADWLVRLAALGGEAPETRFRLSRADARHLGLLKEIGFAGPPLIEVAYRHSVGTSQGALLLRSALAETLPEKAVLETICAASCQTFPVKAADLMPDYEGAALGAKLKELEQLWIDSGFSLDRSALLGRA